MTTLWAWLWNTRSVWGSMIIFGILGAVVYLMYFKSLEEKLDLVLERLDELESGICDLQEQLPSRPPEPMFTEVKRK